MPNATLQPPTLPASCRHGRGGGACNSLPTKAFQRELAEAILSLPPHLEAVVFDVGANDGRWSAALLHGLHASFMNLPSNFKLVLVEPLPFYSTNLEQLARTHAPHIIYHRAAAWTHNAGSLTMHSARPSQLWTRGETSSLLSEYAIAHGATRQNKVGTISLAELIDNYTRPVHPERPNGPGLVAMKLDVEGSEYSLLPTLLLGGTTTSAAAPPLLC